MSFTRELGLVAIGGAFGAALRYSVSYLFISRGLVNFPLATLAVNVIGCFLIGAFYSYNFSSQGAIDPDQHRNLRLLISVGVLGGFTTFSAFGFETILLARDGNFGMAALNIILQLLCGLGAVMAGAILFR